MKQVLSAALEVQQFFEQNDWPFCFIGGVALLAWSDPRLTNDADVVLFTGFGEETRFIEKILARFRSRIPDAEDFAKRPGFFCSKSAALALMFHWAPCRSKSAVRVRSCSGSWTTWNSEFAASRI